MFYILTCLILLYAPINQKLGKKFYFFVVVFSLIFIAGFRSLYVGTDTSGYIYSYLNSRHILWSGISEIISTRYSLFILFQNITYSIFGQNYSAFLLIIATFFCIVVAKFIYRYSQNPAISFLMFLSMGYYWFSMAALKQTIAMGFLLLSLQYILDKKYVKSVLFLLIAGGFHVATLSFACIYLLILLPLNGWYFLFVTIVSVLAYQLGPKFISFVVSTVWGETRSYSTSEFGGTSTLILLIIITLFILLFYQKIFTGKKQMVHREQIGIDQLFTKMIMFGIPIQVLAIYQANAFRVAMMFHIVSIIVVPNTIETTLHGRSKFIGVLLIICLLLIQFFIFTYSTAGIIPFSFVWE